MLNNENHNKALKKYLKTMNGSQNQFFLLFAQNWTSHRIILKSLFAEIKLLMYSKFLIYSLLATAKVYIKNNILASGNIWVPS